MNEDQKLALTNLVYELRYYVQEMSAAVFVPNHTNALLDACAKVESEFGL
jgi:hypothetical protein